MSWDNTLPAWVFEIPVEKLEQGLISSEEFLHIIKNNPSIPNEVVRNWEDKLNENSVPRYDGFSTMTKEIDFDGVSWSVIREEMNTDPGSNTYWKWSSKECYASFLTPSGFRITLKSDGTWSMDSSPHWNGAS